MNGVSSVTVPIQENFKNKLAQGVKLQQLFIFFYKVNATQARCPPRMPQRDPRQIAKTVEVQSVRELRKIVSVVVLNQTMSTS